MLKKFVVPFLMVTALAACGDESNNAATSKDVPPPSREQIMAAEDALPSDPRLADMYERSCMACHTIPETGAPLTGYSAAWAPRLEAKGIEGLVASAKAGMNDNAMPAMGQCMDCSDADMNALITFMMTDAAEGAN